MKTSELNMAEISIETHLPILVIMEEKISHIRRKVKTFKMTDINRLHWLWNIKGLMEYLERIYSETNSRWQIHCDYLGKWLDNMDTEIRNERITTVDQCCNYAKNEVLNLQVILKDCKG